MSKNLDEYLYYNLDEIKRLDAFDLGHAEGIKQKAKEDALEMLKLNMSKDTIAKVTKLSIEVIHELKKELESKEN